jgi:peptidoglycan hydrolase-like protein with peptidoglycan-binding domain
MPQRALAIVAAAACAVIACRHTRHVQSPEQQGEAGGAGRKEEQGGSQKATRERVPPRAGHPAVSATPEGFMQPGSVRRIQDALRSQGLLEGEPTGQLDDATSAALRRFQAAHGLAATGAPDRETLQRLGLDPSKIYRTVPEGAEAEPKD